MKVLWYNYTFFSVTIVFHFFQAIFTSLPWIDRCPGQIWVTSGVTTPALSGSRFPCHFSLSLKITPQFEHSSTFPDQT